VEVAGKAVRNSRLLEGDTVAESDEPKRAEVPRKEPHRTDLLPGESLHAYLDRMEALGIVTRKQPEGGMAVVITGIGPPPSSSDEEPPNSNNSISPEERRAGWASRIDQFRHYLELMSQRAKDGTEGGCYIIFEKRNSRGDVEIDPSGTQKPKPTSPTRFIQFAFGPSSFKMDIPNNVLLEPEAATILRNKRDFYFAEERLKAEHPERKINKYNPLVRDYVVGDEQTAAEDVAYIFSDVWTLPAEVPLYVKAATFDGKKTWEDWLRVERPLSYGEMNAELHALEGKNDPESNERRAGLIDDLMTMDMGMGGYRRAMRRAVGGSPIPIDAEPRPVDELEPSMEKDTRPKDDR
jgi:hypothetical protein